MYGDIKLGLLTSEEVEQFLELIKIYSSNGEQLFLKKVNETFEYYLSVPSVIGATIDDSDQNIYTLFYNCYFIDLYCPSFSFITYSTILESFVSSEDIEGCVLFNDNMNDIINGIRQNTENTNEVFQGIYELLPMENYELEELQQIDIAKEIILHKL